MHDTRRSINTHWLPLRLSIPPAEPARHDGMPGTIPYPRRFETIPEPGGAAGPA